MMRPFIFKDKVHKDKDSYYADEDEYKNHSV